MFYIITVGFLFFFCIFPISFDIFIRSDLFSLYFYRIKWKLVFLCFIFYMYGIWNMDLIVHIKDRLRLLSRLISVCFVFKFVIFSHFFRGKKRTKIVFFFRYLMLMFFQDVCVFFLSLSFRKCAFISMCKVKYSVIPWL